MQPVRRWPGTIPRDLRWVLLAALLARLAGLLLLYILPGQAPLDVGGGDQSGYAFMGQYFLETGLLNDAIFFARPPAYGVLMAAIYAVLGVNPWWMVLTNLLLGVVTAGLAWALARAISGDDRLALLAGLWAALDPAGVVHSLAPLAEALANAALTLALLLTWRLARRPGYRLAALAGLALGLSTLTRPLTQLYGIVLGGWLLLVDWRALGRPAVVLAVISLLPVIGWTQHNARAFGSPEFSIAGPWSMLYMHGTSVLHQATGQSPLDIQRQLDAELSRRLGDEERASRATAISMWDRYILPSPEELDLMRQMAVEIYTQYPLHFILTLGIGAVKMFGWTDELRPVLALEVAYHANFYGLAALGLWPLWRERRQAAILIVLTVLYVCGVTLVIVTMNDTRMRTPLTPLLAILAAYGARHAWGLIRARQRASGDQRRDAR